MTAKGDRILRAGWERTYGWHARPTDWDERWLVLSVTVPESQRKLPHHLQNRLLWAGLGSPAPGEWLTSHAERGEQVAQIVQELGLSDQAHSFVGNLGPVGDPQRLIAAAWNLDDLEKDYRTFIDGYAGARRGRTRSTSRPVPVVITLLGSFLLNFVNYAPTNRSPTAGGR